MPMTLLGFVVTLGGRDLHWDAASGSLRSYVGVEPTVFADRGAAERAIRQTVARWPDPRHRDRWPEWFAIDEAVGPTPRPTAGAHPPSPPAWTPTPAQRARMERGEHPHGDVA